MTISMLMLIVLLLLVIGAFPIWPYNNSWGYYPSSGLGALLIVLVLLVATGRV